MSSENAEPGRQLVLALGSNLGDRLATLQAGLDALADVPGISLQAVSAVFETSPVGGPDQPDYLNAVLLASSALPCQQILRFTQAAEHAQGRVRTVRWGPRTLDIDMIACGEEISQDPELTLPHPRAHERAFVLLPWQDVDPAATLPGYGPVADLVASLGSGTARTVRRRGDLRLTVRPDTPANQGR
ncbi:MAG TPA: 2-amino-4-hydroxy-6-hydroxymethyldihydropteridine diphosphokinase [Streptosporangiaceae bacterium]|nr:2-amino-4-hydroxy-6-hydroxymethyldihydropteridine diphosphokinase [Streptosporangiaceae bacterium]